MGRAAQSGPPFGARDLKSCRANYGWPSSSSTLRRRTPRPAHPRRGPSHLNDVALPAPHSRNRLTSNRRPPACARRPRQCWNCGHPAEHRRSPVRRGAALSGCSGERRQQRGSARWGAVSLARTPLCRRPWRVPAPWWGVSWRGVLWALLAAGVVFALPPYVEPLPGRDGCVTQGGSGNCRAGRALESVSGLVVSRDGRHVYAAVRDSGAVASFRRDGRTGALRQLAGRRGCAGGAPPDGCAAARNLAGARALTLSPDGRSV
jgi:hypothetical protein